MQTFKGKLNIYQVQYSHMDEPYSFVITNDIWDSDNYYLVGQTDELTIEVPDIENLNGRRVEKLKKEKQKIIDSSLAEVEKINAKIAELEAIEFDGE